MFRSCALCVAFVVPANLTLTPPFPRPLADDSFYAPQAKRKGQPLGMERARFYAAEIISALAHVHELKIIHRDLKVSFVFFLCLKSVATSFLTVSFPFTAGQCHAYFDWPCQTA